MSRPSLAGRLLSPLALSNAAIVLSAVIGAVGVIAFVPEPGTVLRDGGSWLAVAVIAEAAFAAVVLILRAAGARSRPAGVAITLVAAGAARGVAIVIGTEVVGLTETAAGEMVGRAVNSALFCLLGGALIGAALAWRHDFREQYRVLVERALMLERAGREDGVVNAEVLAAWASIKAGLDESLRRASAALAGPPSAQALNEAATLLTSAIDGMLRPASRAMWAGALPDRPPISTRSLLSAALETWRPPLRAVLAFFGVLVGIGSVVRVGLVPGLGFTVAYLTVTAIALGLSARVAHRWPGRSIAIAVTTLAVLPVVVFASIVLLADPVLGLAADPVSELVVAIQTPITALLLAMVVEAGRQRQQIIDALQARIDAEAISLLAASEGAHDDARRLSVFMHHSVQSELAALAMQLQEAALTGEAQAMRSIGASVLARLTAIQRLDAAAPPWLEQSDGYQRIAEVVGAWTGILDIQLDLPAAPSCARHQWRVATQVIEEGLANAARHGDASRVVIRGRVDDSQLALTIEDDGTWAPTAGAAGIGLQWLDRIAPGDWELRPASTGSTLAVTIR